MIRKYKQIFMFIFLFVFIAAGSYGLNSKYLGYYENVDSNTRGITSFYVNPGEARDEYDFHAFASCSPKDCDWDHTPLFVYGTDVSDNSHEYATASYKTNFSVTALSLKFMNDGRVLLEGYTRFTDNSNRSNYYFYDIFVKVSNEVEELTPKCPDLVINRIHPFKFGKGARDVTIRVDIKNVGNARSGSCTASIEDKTNKASRGKKHEGTANVQSLGPGETTTVSITINYGKGKWKSKISVEAEVDTRKQVDECNESNNKKTGRN